MSPTTRAHFFLLFAASGCLAALLLLNVHCAGRPPAPARFAAHHTVEERKLYGQTIVLGDGSNPSVRDVARVLATDLTQATGVPFRVSTHSDQGIFLLRSDAPGVPADVVDKLRGQGREAYFLRSQGQGRLLIVANADDGLVFGAYQLLERLGFRFYFPSDKWTITPGLEDIEGTYDTLVKPAFRVRRFAGTGGFGGKLVVDRGQTLEARWTTWKRANGFGEEFKIAGHAGEAFNARHKGLLLKHPEYLASVDGQRVWSKTAKLDPSNPEAVALFVRDRLDAYRKQLKQDPDGAGSFAVSVDAADGGGHCNSPECLRIGGPSEQQFYLANAVARALAEEFPGAQASMHAYNLHASVPRIPLEPNVYVMLVPYAFRRDDATPEAFIAEWRKKRARLSIYDYWSIPDWVADAPVFDFRTTPAKKLRYWQAMGIEGFGAETTYGAGAMGLALYIAGHLMWDTQRDPGLLAEEFYRDAFAESAAPMRRMLERWSAGFLLTAGELASSFADLAEAFQLARSPQVVSRLVDYTSYVQYLRLRYEFLNAPGASQTASKRALLTHLWRIHGSAMVATYRLHRLLLKGDPQLAAEFDPRDERLPIWKALTPFDSAAARRCVASGREQFPNLGISVKTYAGDLVPAAAAHGSPDVPMPMPVAITLMGSSRLELTIPSGVVQLKVELSSTAPIRARIIGENQADVGSIQLEASATPQLFETKISKPGSYWLDFRTTKMGKVTVSTPANVGVELQEFRIPKPAPAPDLYFFVPKGETRVAIYSRTAFLRPERRGPVLLDGADNEVPVERLDGGSVLLASVPAGQDGRIWALRRAVAPSASLKLMNAPQRFALSRAALRVPASALLPVTPAQSGPR